MIASFDTISHLLTSIVYQLDRNPLI